MSRAILSRIFLILTIICALNASACRGDPKSAIVGKWQDNSSDETMQFSTDGKVTVTGKMVITGTYSFPDSTHLVLEFNSLGALANPMVMEYALTSDYLKLTPSTGKILIYKRIK